SGTRITLIDGTGRMRAWYNGRPSVVSDEAARLYHAARSNPADPGADQAVARLRIAGVPLTLVVEPRVGSRVTAWASFLWPALGLLLVTGLVMAWYWRRVRGSAPGLPGAGGSMALGDDDDTGEPLDDSVIAIMRAVGRIAP